MSNDNKNVGVNLHGPLRRFFNTKERTDVNAETEAPTTNVKCRQFRFQQTLTCESNDCTQRSNGSSLRLGANQINNNAKPRLSSKRRKSPPAVINPKRNADSPLPRINGECQCGAKTAPYDYLRCENCFAEDSEKFSGKDQSVVLYD